MWLKLSWPPRTTFSALFLSFSAEFCCAVMWVSVCESSSLICASRIWPGFFLWWLLPSSLLLANSTVRWSRNMAREADGHWNTLSKVTFTAVETLLSKAPVIGITCGDTLSVNSWDCSVYCWCTCSPDTSHLWNPDGFSVPWEGVDELEAEKVNHRSVCCAELVSCTQGRRWIWIFSTHPDTCVPKGIGTPGARNV